MEGPYRELDHGFARLSGREGARRAPPRITCVEDALFELLRNSRDAGARNVYVASTLSRRRYRTLTVIDDGAGIPAAYAAQVFEPGVTTRHLDPAASHPDEPPHGAGLSLYHLDQLSESAEFLSSSNPTSIRVILDTQKLPETSLQSNARPSRSNIPTTLKTLLQPPDPPTIYHASPARILATLLKHRIILCSAGKEVSDTISRVEETARGLGLRVSRRTVRRVVQGSVAPAEPVAAGRTKTTDGTVSWDERRGQGEGPELILSAEELAEVDRIVQRAARSRYVAAGRITERSQASRPGKLRIEVSLYYPEEEYE